MLANINVLSLVFSPVLFYLGSALLVVVLNHLKLLNAEGK